MLHLLVEPRIHGNTWVYVSNAKPDEVRQYYESYALRSGILFVRDTTQNDRLVFMLQSGDLFLTLREENGKTVLYFSREGRITASR